jgi:L-arabinokinase
MSRVIEDIPLIARRSQRSPADIRTMLGIPGDLPVVLASFGGFGLRLNYDAIADAGRFTLVMTDHEHSSGPAAGTRPRMCRVSSGWLTAHGVRYEDLVAAADVVVSKPGYGIVSECIANDTALLYTSRGAFAEQDVFVAEMPHVLRCRELPLRDLLEGRWDPAITALLSQPAPPSSLPTHGAAIAAERILRLAGRGLGRPHAGDVRT